MRNKKKRTGRVKEPGSNRYQLAPSNRDKPTNVPEIEKLIKLKKSMASSVLGDVSAMSQLQRKMAEGRRLRAHKMLHYDDDDTSSQSSSMSSRSRRSNKTTYKPEWSVTNTVGALSFLPSHVPTSITVPFARVKPNWPLKVISGVPVRTTILPRNTGKANAKRKRRIGAAAQT